MNELLETLRKASGIEPHKFACINISIYPKLVKSSETIKVSLVTHSYQSECTILGQKTVTSTEILCSLEKILEELRIYALAGGESVQSLRGLADGQ